MAKWQRQGPKGFKKGFIATAKNAHEGGAKTFGGNPPPTKTWNCPDCGAMVLARNETCGCGGKKPPEPEQT